MTSGGAAAPRRGAGEASRAHLLVALVSGLAVTVLEFAAVRFMAPWFGQSNYVWANVIGVILLALALGYWVGGRIADRSATARPLYLAYVGAAAWVTGVAFLGPTVFDALMPQGIDSSRILPIAFTGSLVASVSLFGPPTLVLGMTSPFLIRLDDRPGIAGRVSGRVFAVGTVGSLAGCYLAPLWLLQTFGSRATILACAAALALLGLVGLVRGARRRAEVVASVVVLAGAVVALSGTVSMRPPIRVLPHQLAEVESGYQTIRVAEEEAPFFVARTSPTVGETVTALTRFLRHDEDAETYQSVWLPNDAKRHLTGGRYYDHMALGAWFARPKRDGPLRVLIVGYAGGSIHRTLRDATGQPLEVTGVEIDPAVVETARRWLDLAELEASTPLLTLITGEDARTVVNALPDERVFDLVLVDAYTRTNYVPFQLATIEFFQRLGKHLAPGGWVGVNVLASHGVGSRLARSVAATMFRAMGDAYLVPNPLYPGSLLLWASPGATEAPRLRGDLPLHDAMQIPAFALERLLVAHLPSDGGIVLTDDLSPSDRLADEELFGW